MYTIYLAEKFGNKITSTTLTFPGQYLQQLPRGGGGGGGGGGGSGGDQ